MSNILQSGVSVQADSTFGPPSELIDISRVYKDVADAHLDDARVAMEALQGSEDLQATIKSELDRSIENAKSSLVEVLNDPVLYAHVKDQHDKSVQAAFEAMQKKTRKKRKRGDPPELSEGIKADIASFQDKLGGIQLKSWPLDANASMFIRAPRYTDCNAVYNIKRSSECATRGSQDIIVIVSVYSRLPYTWNLTERCSQHVLLSSQTLGDLYDIIPCISNELSQQILEDGQLLGSDDDQRMEPSGAVVVIEGMAHGDGMTEPDYADLLVQNVSSDVKKGTNIDETQLDRLTIKLNEPYWLLHEGSCEHWLVFDEIRLPHKDDPLDGYPATLHITPVILDLCRACQKVPAVHAVVGDVRLGESPCLLCEPCWDFMGQGDTSVIVHSLPRHEHGWALDKPSQDGLKYKATRRRNLQRKPRAVNESTSMDTESAS